MGGEDSVGQVSMEELHSDPGGSRWLLPGLKTRWSRRPWRGFTRWRRPPLFPMTSRPCSGTPTTGKTLPIVTATAEPMAHGSSPWFRWKMLTSRHGTYIIWHPGHRVLDVIWFSNSIKLCCKWAFILMVALKGCKAWVIIKLGLDRAKNLNS